MPLRRIYGAESAAITGCLELLATRGNGACLASGLVVLGLLEGRLVLCFVCWISYRSANTIIPSTH